MLESDANNRERLISIPVVILLGLVIIFLLMLLFPSKGTFEDSRYIENPDLLSIAYLKAIFKLSPDNIKLRLTLAQQLISINKWQDALDLINKLEFLNVKNKAQAQLILIQIYLVRYETVDKKNILKAKLLQQTRVLLKNVEINLYDKKQLETIAQIALSINHPEIATDVYKYLAETEKDNSTTWWFLAGKWARASSRSDFASGYYYNAYLSDKKNKDAVKSASLSVLSALDSNKFKLADKYLTEYLTVFKDNQYFLKTAVKSYRVLNNISEERFWNKKLWSLYGQKDEKIILRQLELELALGKLQQAKIYSRILVANNSRNRTYRTRLAQLEEWTGNPMAAQSQWNSLSNKSASTTEDEHVLRLAILNYDDPSIISALDNIGKKRKLTKAEMLRKILTFEKQGELEFTLLELRSYLKEYPEDKDKWLSLSNLFINQNNYVSAIDTLQIIENKFEYDSNVIIQQITLHWIYQQHNNAYLKIESLNSDYTQITKLEQLEILSELGLRFNDNELLLKSSVEIIKRDDENIRGYLNLLHLANRTNDVDLAVMYAESAWYHTGKTLFLRMALEVAIKNSNRVQVDYLLALVFKNKNSTKELVNYIVLIAEIENKEKNFILASKYFEYALKLNSKSISIRVGLLWSLLNSNQLLKLKYYLAIFKSKADHLSQYWAVYSAATLELGESYEAVYWHHKIAVKNPKNYLWILSYADALDAAGQFNAGYKMRTYVINELRGKNIYSMLSNKASYELLNQYFRLEYNLGQGINISKVVDILNDGIELNNISYYFIIAWYDSVGIDDMSRLWHLNKQFRRRKITDSQMLAKAMKSNNSEIINSLVTKKSLISDVDRVEGLRRLAFYDNALAISIEGIGVLSSQQQRLVFREQAASVSNIIANYWAVDADKYNNGVLSENKLTIKFNSNIKNWVYNFSASTNTLEIDPSIVNLRGNNIEQQVNLKTQYNSLGINYYFDIGSNQRTDIDTLPLILGMEYTLSKRTKTDIRWLRDQLSEESAELRTLGKQDRLQISLKSNITSREYFNMQISSVNYKSRWNEQLANGWNVETNIGQRLLSGRDTWLIQMDASSISNNLVNSVPTEVSQRLPAGAETSQLVASEFSTLGVSMRYSRGLLRTNYPQVGSLRFYVDSWLGQVYPTNNFVYRFSSGIATRVVGNDELGVELIVDQTTSKVTEQTNFGISLYYRNYIGR